MILVTVGMQLGFDRLIMAMDRLAPELGVLVIAQTGKGTYRPQHMDARAKIPSLEFEALMREAQLIVSHAGIGTVLSAVRCARPVVLLPRRAELGEHRNDHQMATARSLGGRPGILIAMTEEELPGRISEGLAVKETRARTSPTAAGMQQALARFIDNLPV